MNVPTYWADGLMRQGNAADARAYLGVSGGAVLFSAGALSSLRSDITFSNSNGVSFGLSNNGVLTASVAPGAGAGTGFTSATTPGTNIVGTLGAGGLSLGIPAYLTTAQPPGAYLTTAMASNAGSNFAGTNGSIVGGSFTLNSSGATISLPAYLTTAQPPGAYLTTAALSQDSSKYAGTGFSTATTAGTNIVGTLSNNGLSMGIPAYLTTAAAGTGVGTNTSTVTTSGTNLTFAADTNGISIAYPDWLTTAAAAGAGTGFTSTTTGGSVIVGTLDTNGLSLGVPKYLTTAAPPSAVATLSFYENLPTLVGGVSVPMNNFVSSVPVQPFVLPQAASVNFFRLAARNAIGNATLSGTSANTSFSFQYTHTTALVLYTQGTGASSLSLLYYTSTLASLVSNLVFTAGATGSYQTLIYNLSFPQSGDNSHTYSTQSNHTSASFWVDANPLAYVTGLKWFDIPFDQYMTPGNYWFALGQSRASASNSGPNFSAAVMANSIVAQAEIASTWGNIGVATAATNQNVPGCGYWATNSAFFSTSAMDLSKITNAGVRFYFQLLRVA